MMDAEHEDLARRARRAVACQRWRWMPGMLLIGGHRVDGDDVLSEYRPAYALPDLTDPATLGCLLALVREAWSNKIVIRIGDGWGEVETDAECWAINTSDLASILISALEAAP